jgi:hypothetical protein
MGEMAGTGVSGAFRGSYPEDELGAGMGLAVEDLGILDEDSGSVWLIGHLMPSSSSRE